jgi:hypothetical protein
MSQPNLTEPRRGRPRRGPDTAPKFHFDPFANFIGDRLADGDPDDLLTDKYLALKAQVSPMWFQTARSGGYGPKFVKLGPRMVRYRRKDAVAWFRSRPTV